jgi:hypothetical protein
MNAMEIVNSIGWRSGWLRKVVGYCCRELDYPPPLLRKATFRKAHRSTYRGRAHLESREIRVKINPANRYPLATESHRGLPPLRLSDAVEVLVNVTAHEVAHLERWERFARDWRRRGKRDTFCEQDTESLARRVLAAFRADRGRLLAGWGVPGPGPIPPSWVYASECPCCGTVRVRSRPSSKAYCLCRGRWKPGMDEPTWLEWRRIPAAV